MAEELYKKLAEQNIRVFVLDIDEERLVFIHPQKKTDEWRCDVARIKASISLLGEYEDYSESEVWRVIYKALQAEGYIEIKDIASDVYEGRVSHRKSTLVDDPMHGNKSSGFGHYGWESK